MSIVERGSGIVPHKVVHRAHEMSASNEEIAEDDVLDVKLKWIPQLDDASQEKVRSEEDEELIDRRHHDGQDQSRLYVEVICGVIGGN